MNASTLLGLGLCVVVFASGMARGEPEWGKANEQGLAVRLVPLTKTYAVGKPLTFRVVAKNEGEQTVYVDLQSLAHLSNVLEIRTGVGAVVRCVSADLAGCQTFQEYKAFAPGKVVTVIDRIDAGAEFAIMEDGAYRLRFPGTQNELPELARNEETIGADGEKLDHRTRFANLPVSKELRIDVKPGKLSPELAMIKALRPITPKGWFLCRRWEGDGITIGKHGAQAFVSVDLFALAPGAANKKLEDGQVNLGPSPHGEIRMKVTIVAGKAAGEPPEDAKLDDFWKGAEPAIRRALKIGPGEA